MLLDTKEKWKLFERPHFHPKETPLAGEVVFLDSSKDVS